MNTVRPKASPRLERSILFKADEYEKENKRLVVDFIGYIEDEMNYSPATVSSWRYLINIYRIYLGNTDLRDLTIRDLSAYFTVRGKKVAVSSLNVERSIIRSFFKYLTYYRGMRFNFDYSMIRNAKEDERETNFVTPERLNLILSKLENTQDRLVVVTFFATGMRIGEVVNLSVDNLQGREISIKGKGGRRRVIPISRELASAIQDHIYENNISIGPIFRHQVTKSSVPNTAFTVSGLRKRLQRNLAKHDIKLKPHELRHGAATELLMNGMDIRTLMTFLGHRRIETTQRYTHITDNHLKEAVAKANHLAKIDIKSVLTK